MIKRKAMKDHINNKCPMTTLQCDECKVDVLRKDKKNHIVNDCPEHEVECPYKSIGCNVKIKRKLLEKHLSENELNHLKSEV